MLFCVNFPMAAGRGFSIIYLCSWVTKAWLFTFWAWRKSICVPRITLTEIHLTLRRSVTVSQRRLRMLLSPTGMLSAKWNLLWSRPSICSKQIGFTILLSPEVSSHHVSWVSYVSISVQTLEPWVIRFEWHLLYPKMPSSTPWWTMTHKPLRLSRKLQTGSLRSDV